MKDYEAIKEDILESLKEKAPNLKCPACDNKNFVMADGFFADPLQKKFDNFSLGGETIPSAVLICSKCGYVMRFSIGILGLLPERIEKEQKDGNK